MMMTSRHELYEAIQELSIRAPSMRLGQLLAGASTLPDGGPYDLEEVPDSALVEAIQHTVQARRARVADQDAEPEQMPLLRIRLLEALEGLGQRNSELSFGQLVSRTAERARVNVYDVEDDQLLEAATKLLGEPAALPRVSFAVTFPHVILGELKYADRLAAADYQCITVPDGRQLLQWYFRTMTGAKEFEWYVQGAENRAQPDVLTRDNFTNIRRIAGIGWSNSEVAPLVDQALPELGQIPLDADLLKTNAYDDLVVRLVEGLSECRGIKITNASKLLYQKRPALIPILDSWVRQALNVPYTWDGDRQREAGLKFFTQEVFPAQDAFPALAILALWFHFEPGLGPVGLGLRQVRYVVGVSHNHKALENLTRWLSSKADITEELRQLSTIRLLDILAWSVMWHLKNGAPPFLSAEGEQLLQFN